MISPYEIDNWSVVLGDRALHSALNKERSRQNNQTVNITDYQKKNLLEALEFVKIFNLAIDAGANYGLMSFNLNERFNEVHSFEVDDNVRNCFKENVHKFNLNRITVHDCGLSDKEELVSLTYNKNTFGTSINKLKEGSFVCRTIDSFNFQDLNFLKIDCEGYEPFIIRGGENTIKKFRPVILMEDKNLSRRYYGTEGNLSVDILKSWGYSIKIGYSKECILVSE